MGDRDRDNYKSRKRYDDEDDDYRERRDKRREPNKNALERILTPGAATNNLIKTAATGIIAAGTFLLMTVYGVSGDRLAGASYLPMATLVVSAIGTACVWIFGRPKTEEAYNEEFTALRKKLRDLDSNLDEIQAHNAELENRLANVELLESFEDRLAKHTLEKEAQVHRAESKTSNQTPISSDIPTISADTSVEIAATQKAPEQSD